MRAIRLNQENQDNDNNGDTRGKKREGGRGCI